MLLPYGVPHECESAEIADLLGQLSPKQRRALRAYVWEVELGEKSLTAWLASDTCPVSRSTWYQAGGHARYWCNEGFKAALRAYLAAGLKWRTSQDRRDVERARRTLLLETPHAAERLAEAQHGDIGQLFRMVERWTDEPLPSQEILAEELRDDPATGIKRRFYQVRQAALDLSKLADPRFSRMVKKFSDSPTRGVSIEIFDPVQAAESILDRADLETAAKTQPAGGGVVVVIPDNGRADRGPAGAADEVSGQPG